MAVPVVVLDEEGVPVTNGLIELVVLRVANGLAVKVVVRVTSADPETETVADGVVSADPVPDPVCVREAVDEGVPEAVKEGVVKAEGVCVSKEEAVPDLDLVWLAVWSAEPV